MRGQWPGGTRVACPARYIEVYAALRAAVRCKSVHRRRTSYRPIERAQAAETRPTAIQERSPRTQGEESNRKPNYVTAVLTACYRSGVRGVGATGGVCGAEVGVSARTCTPHVTRGGTMTDRTGTCTGSINFSRSYRYLYGPISGHIIRDFDAMPRHSLPVPV
jgi:hypothetical protein